MEQYTVTGMSCAACSARVEKAVSAVPGVDSCAVSLLTNSMGVEGTADPAAVVAAVEKAGYGAELRRRGQAGQSGQTGQSELSGQADRTAAGTGTAADDPSSALADRETPVLIRRLAASAGFLAVLMYLSMGHGMLGWPVPAFLHDNPAAFALCELLLAAAVMVVNQKFFVNGFRGVLHGAPNMDTLVGMGSAAAFVYSTAMLFVMLGKSGDAEAEREILHGLYFESAAMILCLITVGKTLEARSKGKTTSALRSLMDLAPKTARVLRDGEEITVPAAQVRKGDIFVLRPGDSVPADGTVLEGESAVDESALTGESIPVDKGPGDAVSAATLNRSGYLRCEAVRVGEDTALSGIIRLVSDAAATKAPIARIADKVSAVFVPAVMAIALVTTAVWWIVGPPGGEGQRAGFALARGISVLVISCPCALGLATPVAIMAANGVGAKNGILFKTSAALEECGRIRIAALDKTGTVTKGEPEITDLCPADGVSAADLLAKAAALENRSEHPLARAVLRRAEAEGIEPGEITSFRALPGNGLEGVLDGRKLAGGSGSYISGLEGLGEETRKLRPLADALSEAGKTPLYFAEAEAGSDPPVRWKLLGVLAAADTVRDDSAEAVRQLREMGVRTVLLTGDNERTARAVAKQAGIDEEDVAAGVLPDGKEAVIRALSEKGKTMMVGDGINDAPALTRADTGAAIGTGTDVAVEAGDVVLMKSSLLDAAAAVRLSRAALGIIRENLFWAFFYNCIGIPLAAGVFIVPFGWELHPMFGAAAMSLSSFCVVTNALRLNLVKVRDPSRDKKIKNPVAGPLFPPSGPRTAEDPGEHPTAQEETKMKKVMKIEGMMCPHCEARVKKALEALDGVLSAAPSHEKNEAVLELSKDVPDEALVKAVTDAGYEVKGIG